MKVRFKFSADLVVNGESLDQIREKWENLPLFSQEAQNCGVEFCETLLITDSETYEDLTDEMFETELDLDNNECRSDYKEEVEKIAKENIDNFFDHK